MLEAVLGDCALMHTLHKTVQQIDEMIARLEDRQRHGNLSTAEERRTLAEIEKAKGSRKVLRLLEFFLQY